ncbi:MAG: phospholipase D family protein [Arenicellales bacterium]
MNKFISICVVSSLILLMTGCVSAPIDYPKQASVAMTDVSGTREALKVRKWLGGKDDVNGFYPLSQGFDAFGARLRLMDVAEKSIDAQYFLMKPDNAGLVFAAGLLKAADRGVRVRFLLDDVFTSVDDVDLAMLDDHPNIEVRIFNPISRKGIYAFNYLGHFSLANRRMHNKSFTIDNLVAVVGGRNIAAEYFQLETTGEFFDFDMLSVGPVVREVSNEFDTYWNHQLAVPVAALFNEDDKDKLVQSYAQVKRNMAEAGESIYAQAITTPVITQLDSFELKPYIAEARLISDDPQKLLEDVSQEMQLVVNEMRAALLAAEEEILIFTPYLIPRKRGIELVRELREKGIRITILTNSLATNNHTSVHSAYARYRKDLLDAGVELWEARADAAKITSPEGETQLEKLTLHTKGILIDRKRVFVGSLNLDPRSIDINTEMGLLIDSPDLGKQLTENSRKTIPEIAYRVKMDDSRNLSWHATIDGKEVVETTEPQTTGWDRFKAWFLKIAPEKQL